MQSFHPIDVLDSTILEPLTWIVRNKVWPNPDKEVFVFDDEELYYSITHIGRNLLILIEDDEEIGW